MSSVLVNVDYLVAGLKAVDFAMDEVAAFLLPSMGRLTQDELQAVLNGLGYDKDQATEALGYLMMGLHGKTKHPQFHETMDLLNKMVVLGLEDDGGRDQQIQELLEREDLGLKIK